MALRRSLGAGNPLRPAALRLAASQTVEPDRRATPLRADRGGHPLAAIAGHRPQDRHHGWLGPWPVAGPRPAGANYPLIPRLRPLLRIDWPWLPGETATIVATCGAAMPLPVAQIPTSRSLELQLQDITGRLRISNFFAGKRFPPRAG